MTSLADIRDAIHNRTAKVAVVGLGYVGLPLLLSFAKGGFQTIGIDVDDVKIDALHRGQSYIKHIDAQDIQDLIADGNRLAASTDFSKASEADAIILCLPTPLDQHFEPDLSFVVSTMKTLMPHLRPGQLISLESTTYPGTTEEEIVPRIEQAGFKVGEDIFVVYSPEREDPGNPKYAATNIPKVVGGASSACCELGSLLYGAVFEQIVPVSSLKVAELTKLLENIYRCVNIGLVNELKIVSQSMGIDIWEVIQAASTKPFGFSPFYPGPGLGGHCIPIDPFYLTWKAREYGLHTRFIELAGQINRSMPEYVIQKVVVALNSEAKAVRNSRILIVGLAYKPNVDDLRESPTFALMDLLREYGAEVEYHDPYIPTIGATRDHLEWKDKVSVPWTQESIRSFDLVLISTWHDCLNKTELASWATLVVDTRNALAEVETPNCQVFEA